MVLLEHARATGPQRSCSCCPKSSLCGVHNLGGFKTPLHGMWGLGGGGTCQAVWVSGWGGALMRNQWPYLGIHVHAFAVQLVSPSVYPLVPVHLGTHKSPEMTDVTIIAPAFNFLCFWLSQPPTLGGTPEKSHETRDCSTNCLFSGAGGGWCWCWCCWRWVAGQG